MENLTACSCGSTIEFDSVEIQHHTNEEGEESTNIEFDCPKCEVEFDLFEWGTLDKTEAVEALIEKLAEKNNNSDMITIINSKGGIGKTN